MIDCYPILIDVFPDNQYIRWASVNLIQYYVNRLKGSKARKNYEVTNIESRHPGQVVRLFQVRKVLGDVDEREPAPLPPPFGEPGDYLGNLRTRILRGFSEKQLGEDHHAPDIDGERPEDNPGRVRPHSGDLRQPFDSIFV